MTEITRGPAASITPTPALSDLQLADFDRLRAEWTTAVQVPETQLPIPTRWVRSIATYQEPFTADIAEEVQHRTFRRDVVLAPARTEEQVASANVAPWDILGPKQGFFHTSTFTFGQIQGTLVDESGGKSTNGTGPFIRMQSLDDARVAALTLSLEHADNTYAVLAGDRSAAYVAMAGARISRTGEQDGYLRGVPLLGPVIGGESAWIDNIHPDVVGFAKSGFWADTTNALNIAIRAAT